MQQLEIASLRELEDMLITDCIYPGLLDARLDQRQQQLIVFHTYGRDVHPDKLPALVDALDAW
jgi:COP9 signalosome complex subunit 7